jgi:hypothetical protein
MNPPPADVQAEAQAANAKKPKIPAVRRGHRRRGRAVAMHDFWGDHVGHEISKAGRR